jgi:hypothetical protein
MAHVSIDRIDIDLPGFSAQRGERIARLIAEGLAGCASFRTTPAAVSDLDVQLVGMLGESDEALARRIVAGIIRQLDRAA